MNKVTKACIFAKPHVALAVELVPELIEWLKARAIGIRMDEEAAQYAGVPEAGLPREQVPDGSQLAIVLGGDGTLISAARAIAGREIPLFAVNLGGLGFLTAIPVDETFTELERCLRGENHISRRRLMHAALVRQGEKIAEYEALNDVVITKSSIARMIQLEAQVDGKFVCNYRADGLIVASATGSTAYSLSAGGPIVHPSVHAFCITPICPHMLANRPVIVSASSVIGVICHAEDEAAFLTIDGQVGQPLLRGDQIECRGSEHEVLLARSQRKMFFEVLREKLKWGDG